MVIDTSALIAILANEVDAERYEAAIAGDPVRLISAATLLETSLVIESRLGEEAGRELDLLLHKARFEVVSVDADQIEIARDAFRRFGKGRHRAGLNFGDCFSYAAAMAQGEGLLFKGDDFGRTDVTAVLSGE